MIYAPHPWLGLDYQDLLHVLRQGQLRLRVSVTRPFGQSYGSGKLRVVRVTCAEDSTSEVSHCVLAYERYQSFNPPRPKQPRAPRGREGGHSSS